MCGASGGLAKVVVKLSCQQVDVLWYYVPVGLEIVCVIDGSGV